MWPGEQPPGNGQNPQGQFPQGQNPNPYQQPVQGQSPDPNPYMQPAQAPWAAPTMPMGAPLPPQQPGNRRGKTTAIAVVSAVAVLVAAGVAGFLILGGGEDDSAQPQPTGSPSGKSNPSGSAGSDDERSDGNPRAGDNAEPVVPGWQTVTRGGLTYDAPPQWALKSKDWVSYVADDRDPEEKPLVGFGGGAVLKERWCRSDDDRNGSQEDTPLATMGSRTERDATDAAKAARENAELWVFGGYAQPDKNKVRSGAVEEFTTTSGIKGSLVTATSSGVAKTGKCDTDGKATAFVFRNADNDFVSWTFIGARGVNDEVPDTTVRKILSTLRLAGDAKTS